jgi:hypothetical protein
LAKLVLLVGDLCRATCRLVEDVGRSRNWFIETMGFSFLGQSVNVHTITEMVGINDILFLLSAPLKETSPVASYLKKLNSYDKIFDKKHQHCQ